MSKTQNRIVFLRPGLISIVVLLFLLGLLLLWSIPYKVPLGQTKNNGFASIEQVPELIKKSIVRVEDRRFYMHRGVDLFAWARVARSYLLYDRLQGGSTIHQQVVKLHRNNFTRTWRIKLEEIIGALQLGMQYSHDEVLLEYLNSVQRKNNVVGRNAACRSFYGKGCDLITPGEFYILLAASQRGGNLLREDNYEQVVNRAVMLCRNYHTPVADCNAISLALIESIRFHSTRIDPRISLMLTDEGYQTDQFDINLYSSIQNVIQESTFIRDSYNAGACCVMVLGEGGTIRSANVCGSWGSGPNSMVNSCMQPRQTGSAIKPFLYAYAVKSLGYTKDTIVDDSYVSYDLGDGSLYEPKNFDLRYHGEVSLAYALGNSLNVSAVKLLDRVGMGGFYNYLDSLALQYTGLGLGDLPPSEVGLSMALGTIPQSPLQFTSLRQVFFEKESNPEYREIQEILSNYQNKIVGFGQDGYLNKPGWAVKTGTSRLFIDGRICGAKTTTDHVAVCVRFGNHSNAPMLASSSEVGGFIFSQIVDIIDSK